MQKVTDFTATFIILSKYRFVLQYEPQTGLEPVTFSLRVKRSTN